MLPDDKLRDYYRLSLNPAFVHGQAVLRDICSFCDVLTPFDYDPNAPRADLDLARAEGRRDVALYILDQIGQDSLRTISLLITEDQNDRPSADADAGNGDDND